MGFIKPAMPDLDYDAWRAEPRAERIRPMAQEWGQAGFGTPDAVVLLYVVKIGLYLFGGLAITAATPGIGTLGDVADWWTEPILWQKVVVFTLLFEVLGLGCGFGPLTLRFLPPIGAWLHWLRPGTIRLPPWPGKVPGTAGTRRTAVDVLLYAGVVASLVWILVAHGDAGTGTLTAAVGAIEPLRFVPFFVLMVLLGLRDKTIFLAGRTEVYGTLALMCCFSGADFIIGSKLLLLLIWWGAATSKLNKHFPYVVSVMMSNSPILRLKALKRRFHRNWPDDLRPSRFSGFLAHFGTVIEYSVPLVLLLSFGGKAAVIAAVVMTLFHLQILTSLPMGVPLEWNVFMIFGVWFLFVQHGDVTFGDLSSPLPVLVAALLAVVVVLGNLFPATFSFLPAMRYYAGNWATSMWAIRPEAVAKLDAHVTKAAQLPFAQLQKLYGDEMAFALGHKGYAFRAMHPHGRALFGMVERYAGPAHERDYVLHDGEFVAGAMIGWNFGEGHLHNEQLIEALQERCHFEPGDIRVMILESQPFWRPQQQYRLVDAATGEFERGYVEVADMLARQPWDVAVPAHPTSPAHLASTVSPVAAP
jgi:hypothetical protein